MVDVRITREARQRLERRQVIASLSGGKDSTALALWLRELEIPHVRVFADTGFEAPRPTRISTACWCGSGLSRRCRTNRSGKARSPAKRGC